MYLTFPRETPVLFVSGVLYGLLQNERTSREWTLEVLEEDGSLRPLRSVPRHLTTDNRGSLWFPNEDGRTNRVPFLRLSGIVESFVSVDRIRSLSFEEDGR